MGAEKIKMPYLLKKVILKERITTKAKLVTFLKTESLYYVLYAHLKKV